MLKVFTAESGKVQSYGFIGILKCCRRLAKFSLSYIDDITQYPHDVLSRRSGAMCARGGARIGTSPVIFTNPHLCDCATRYGLASLVRRQNSGRTAPLVTRSVTRSVNYCDASLHSPCSSEPSSLEPMPIMPMPIIMCCMDIPGPGPSSSPDPSSSSSSSPAPPRAAAAPL